MSNVTPFRGKMGDAAGERAHSQGELRVYLVGTMRALGPNGEDILPRARKTQAVLAYLCLAQGEHVSRSRIAGAIWDRAGEAQARDSLRHALTELERARHWPIEADKETVRLDLNGCWVDVLESPEESDQLLDSLHGISVSFDQWLLGARVRFDNHWQATLETELKELVGAEASPELRAAAARKLLNFMPTHENAVRCLMTAFAEMGDRAQAVREFERFRQVVMARLGMEPSEKTMALYSAIRLGSRSRSALSLSAAQRNDGCAERSVHRHSDLIRPEMPDSDYDQEREPSIAVLPFRSLSDGTARDHVAIGLVEDIIEGLSRVPGLFVVSRLSAAAVGSQNRSPEEIGDLLGVRYLLSGSVRTTGTRVRLAVELTDTTTGRPLWNSRFDEECFDLLRMQDRLTDSVIRSVAPNVRAAELRRGHSKRQEHRDAYDSVLRAQEHMHDASRAEFEAAEQLFDQALAREPHYPAALAWRAYWHVMRVGQGWSPDPARDTAQADRFARLAIQCDASEPMAFAVQGHVATFLYKDFDLAFSAFEAALRINPNCARAWLWNANAQAYMGQGAPAVEKVKRAMALSPYDPLVCAFSGGASLAYLADRQYERAIEFALRCIRQNRSYSAAYRLLIVALVLAGRKDEARSPVHQLLRLEPGFTVQQNRCRFPGSAYPFGELYSDALARAGVPPSN